MGSERIAQANVYWKNQEDLKDWNVDVSQPNDNIMNKRQRACTEVCHIRAGTQYLSTPDHSQAWYQIILAYSNN